jgi:hypothetical protein
MYLEVEIFDLTDRFQSGEICHAIQGIAEQ